MKNIIIVAFFALLSANALAGSYTTISGDTTNISLEEYKKAEKQKSAELKLASAQSSKGFKEQDNARKARQKAEKEAAFKAYLESREKKLKANGK